MQEIFQNGDFAQVFYNRFFILFLSQQSLKNHQTNSSTYVFFQDKIVVLENPYSTI